MIDFRFSAPLWRWKGDGAWHFVTVPDDISVALKALSPDAKRGFGSVRVRVKTGQTEWKTSVFPDKSSGCYLLPVKKEVRKVENLTVDRSAEYELELAL